MNQPFDFQAQLKRGEAGEKTLDAYFGQRFQIRKATMAEQRRGIDRFFTNPENGRVYTSEAEWIFYYLPDAFAVYAVSFTYLRAKVLPLWAARYPLRSAKNKTYTTYGLIVPVAIFARCASKTFDLRQELHHE